MRRLIAIIFMLAVAFGALPAHALDVPTADELVSGALTTETSAVAPGATVWADIRLTIKTGWHIYWRNPGDAGLPTSVAWTLPQGFAAGDIEWPAPEHFRTGNLGNYGYRGTVDLLVPIAAPAAPTAHDAMPVEATVSWLACTEICIPGETKLSAALGGGTTGPDRAARFAAARTRLPQAPGFSVGVTDEGKDYRLAVPGSAVAGLDRPTAAFFPYDGNAIDQAAAQPVSAAGDGLALVVAKPDGAAAKSVKTLDGVLEIRAANGESRAFAIGVRPVVATAAETVVWWEAMLLAFLAGLILNLMPCVFPILSLKVLALAGLTHRRDGLHHGLAYGAGVVLSFAALGGALLALRDGGSAIGWGFQLQSPVVVGLLAYLLLAMGLSLSGVAEFGTGWAGAGGRFAERAGLVGAFATGVLATIVATPCTAPFMGTALGFALIAPAPIALGVFVALGAGLAAPFMIAAAWPGMARRMPRPGPWMVVTRQVLAFPLYGTVAWLIWVLVQEVEPGDALMAMFGLVAVAFAVWIYGRTRTGLARMRRVGDGLAALGLAVAVALAATLSPAAARPLASARGGLPYEAFSSARLATLTADRKPVFVNLTASWCITCLVNEHATLDRDAVRRVFAAHGVVALKGDWTRRNPDITEFLRRYGRSGVPLYLLYDKAGDATILPQILTEAAVLQAVGNI